MKLTRATLKQIIKEELAKMTEIADTQVDAQSGTISATPGAGESDEVAQAMAGLADVGVTDARGNLMPGKVLPDVAAALADMRVSGDVMRAVMSRMEAAYR